jgi:hypothetical protein
MLGDLTGTCAANRGSLLTDGGEHMTSARENVPSSTVDARAPHPSAGGERLKRLERGGVEEARERRGEVFGQRRDHGAEGRDGQ